MAKQEFVGKEEQALELIASMALSTIGDLDEN